MVSIYTTDKWRILIRSYGLAERYTEQHCTFPLDRNSRSEFVSATKNGVKLQINKLNIIIFAKQ